MLSHKYISNVIRIGILSLNKNHTTQRVARNFDVLLRERLVNNISVN